MTTHFHEILEIEDAALARVRSPGDMTRWRSRVVRELMRPRSLYATALRAVTDGPCGRDFLATWQALLTSAVDRVLTSLDPQETRPLVGGRTHDDPDAAEELAVLILAALHGGGLLSRVTDDPAPLEAALDIALAPLTTSSAR